MASIGHPGMFLTTAQYVREILEKDIANFFSRKSLEDDGIVPFYLRPSHAAVVLDLCEVCIEHNIIKPLGAHSLLIQTQGTKNQTSGSSFVGLKFEHIQVMGISGIEFLLYRKCHKP